MNPYIISASRREDIPGFENRINWLLDRIKDGYIDISGFYQDYRINFDKTKLIVFWTKNPQPLIDHLDKIPFKYYFQYSLNDYPEYELRVPPLQDRIDTFINLSKKIGKEKVIWRYDPIIIDNKIKEQDLLKRIENIGNQLFPYTEKLVFSFIDPYKKLKDKFIALTNEQMINVGRSLVEMNKNWGLELSTCSEVSNLEGISHNKCIDPILIERICGKQRWLNDKKDKSQREACVCISSGDIGEFKTCRHFCDYCVDENTLILMGDSTFKKIKDVNIGDEIYGVDREGYYKKYVKNVVIKKWITYNKSYKITLNNGTELICSANHRWLTQRGWRHTYGKLKINGEFSSPLTTNSKLFGFGYSIDNSIFDENIEYKRGYLCGAMIGDGTIGKYDYSGRRKNRKIDIQHKFRFVVKDVDIMNRFKKYLNDLDIKYFDLKFPMIDRKNKNIIICDGIVSSSILNYNIMKNIIDDKFNNDINFLKGFMSGIYDTEGDSGYAKRIYNCDNDVMKIIEKSLSLYNFKYIYDKNRFTKNKILKTIRILGGSREHLRFYNIFRPNKNKFNFYGMSMKHSENLYVKNIELFKENQKLIDLTTTTGNFIANGIISHNCYAS